MNGYEAMAKILKAEGVEWLSCFPAQPLIDACSREGIRPILCRQERAGVNMADGFSRIHNGKKIGVFTMQTGPGAENAFGGVAQGYADSVPFLAIPGGNPAPRQGVHPNFESVPNYQGITKWAGIINMPERIPEMVGRAMTHLKHGRLGPVLLEFPGDVAAAEFPGELNYKPVEVRKSGAAPEDVRDVVTALLNASAPVMNVGQGVLYAEATPELIEFAELTNIPVMTTLAGKSAFPETHPLSLGTGASSGTLMCARFLENADLVAGIGTSFTISNFNAPMPAGVTLAHITNCAEDINKDYRADYGAVGDAKVVLRQMIEEVKSQVGAEGRGDVNGVRDEIKKIRDEYMAEWGPNFVSDEVPISPYRVFNEMMANVDIANTIVTHDSGYPREQIVPFWPVTTPRGYIGWGKSTQLGYGLGSGAGREDGAARQDGHQHHGRCRVRHGGPGHRDRSALQHRHADDHPEQRRDDPLLRPLPACHRALGQQPSRRRVREGRRGPGRIRGARGQPRRGERRYQASARSHEGRPARSPRNDDQGRGEHLPLLALNNYRAE